MTKPREPGHTVAFVDEYFAHYRSVFHTVRHFEQFTQLELGLLAETKRKSLPRLAKTAQADHQALHHFLANTEWSVDALHAIRLRLTRDALAGRPELLCIDETGDRKKGHTTDYAASQYIGNLHGLANGVVSVNAYGVLDTVTFPLAFRVYKPKSRLKAGDIYKSKPRLNSPSSSFRNCKPSASGSAWCSPIVSTARVANSSPRSIAALHRLGLQYVVAIRSNHGVWLFPGQRLRRTRWRPFDRRFTDGSSEQRFIRETIFGTRHRVRYFEVTTDPLHLPRETTWDLMTNLPGKIEQTVGNTFGLRTQDPRMGSSRPKMNWVGPITA